MRNEETGRTNSCIFLTSKLYRRLLDDEQVLHYHRIITIFWRGNNSLCFFSSRNYKYNHCLNEHLSAAKTSPFFYLYKFLLFTRLSFPHLLLLLDLLAHLNSFFAFQRRTGCQKLCGRWDARTLVTDEWISTLSPMILSPLLRLTVILSFELWAWSRGACRIINSQCIILELKFSLFKLRWPISGNADNIVIIFIFESSWLTARWCLYFRSEKKIR